MTVSITPRLGAIAADYAGFIIDLWGTVHDGFDPYPGVVECLATLREAGKHVVLLSNAPRRTGAVVPILDEIGVEPELYDAIYTSGEEAWLAIAERPDDWYRALGRRCFFMGADGDLEMLDNPGLDAVTDLGDADFVLCTGFANRKDTVEDVVPMLQDAANRDLPMICANPDIVVHRGPSLEFCAGAMARHYEQAMAGTVRYHGKPHASVFHAAMQLMGIDDVSKVLMIGDGLPTDIAGANAIAMPNAFIPGGIAAGDLGIKPGEAPDTDPLENLFAAAGQTPTTTLPALNW